MTLRFFLLVSCLVFFDNAHADHHAPDKSWTFTFRFENDLFAGTDRHYTNGIKLSFISPDLTRFRDSDKLPEWGKRIVSYLPYSQVEGLQRNIVFSIGQNMYTPADIRTRELIKDDRPYAGWLYGSAAFHNKDYRHLDTFEIQAGFVGPLSLAEEAQNFIHDLRGIDRARGWDNQLKDEPGLDLIYEHKDRVITPVTLKGFGFDAITHYGGALGNVFTYANAGVEMRLGWNLPSDFGTSLIRPGGETNAPAATMDPRYEEIGHGFSLHAFAAVSGRLVLRDIFLDGNTFRDSHSVDKEFLVGDVVCGISLIVDSFKVSYAQALRTREFRGQDDDQKFGSITISYTY
jgi:lipid A 3-O-deacylase